MQQVTRIVRFGHINTVDILVELLDKSLNVFAQCCYWVESDGHIAKGPLDSQPQKSLE